MDSSRAHYDDGTIACDDDGLAIQRYYPWGALRVRYEEIRAVQVLPIKGWSKFQPWLWGPSDLVHWWNLDRQRQHRRTAIVLDIGGRFKPTVTPLDPRGFEQIVRARMIEQRQPPASESLDGNLEGDRSVALPPEDRGDAQALRTRSLARPGFDSAVRSSRAR